MTLASCGLHHELKEALDNYDDNHEMKFQKVAPGRAVAADSHMLMMDEFGDYPYQLRIKGSIDVVMTDSVVVPTLVVADEEDLNRVSVMVVEQRFCVDYRGRRRKNDEKITLYMPCDRTVYSVKAADASRFFAPARALNMEMIVEASDAAYVELNCCDSADVDGMRTVIVKASDAASVMLKEGRVGQLCLEMEDAASLNALLLAAEHVTVEMKDCSSATVNAEKTIDGKMKDASTLSYKGEPELSIEKKDIPQITQI